MGDKEEKQGEREKRRDTFIQNTAVSMGEPMDVEPRVAPISEILATPSLPPDVSTLLPTADSPPMCTLFGR